MIDLILAFALEFIRALLIDELSDHVRGRIEAAKQARCRRRHSKRAARLIRNLSTEKEQKVR